MEGKEHGVYVIVSDLC